MIILDKDILYELLTKNSHTWTYEDIENAKLALIECKEQRRAIELAEETLNYATEHELYFGEEDRKIKELINEAKHNLINDIKI